MVTTIRAGGMMPRDGRDDEVRMSSRREQVRAYRFLTRRIVSAMLTGEPETNELPMRRFAHAVFGSLMVAVLVFVGVGVYGLLNPAGRRPAENTVILERETGAKYLYLQGLLHPVANWTSARLILAQATPPVQTMSQASLRDVPRGRPVGIPNLPDDLPGKSALLGLPWGVCSAPLSPASVIQDTSVFVGHVPADGTPLDDTLVARWCGPAPTKQAYQACLTDHGVFSATYWEPASRFWAMQWLDVAVFGSAALALLVVGAVLTARRRG